MRFEMRTALSLCLANYLCRLIFVDKYANMLAYLYRMNHAIFHITPHVRNNVFVIKVVHAIGCWFSYVVFTCMFFYAFFSYVISIRCFHAFLFPCVFSCVSFSCVLRNAKCVFFSFLIRYFSFIKMTYDFDLWFSS